jgi:hypothetical protein
MGWYPFGQSASDASGHGLHNSSSAQCARNGARRAHLRPAEHDAGKAARPAGLYSTERHAGCGHPAGDQHQPNRKTGSRCAHGRLKSFRKPRLLGQNNPASLRRKHRFHQRSVSESRFQIQLDALPGIRRFPHGSGSAHHIPAHEQPGRSGASPLCRANR